MKRQSSVLSFIRTVDVLLKHKIVEEECFKKAIVMTSVYVLRIGIESKDTVELSIFSLQILLNALGLKLTINSLDRFFSLAVHAFLNFPDNKKIHKYTSKIFEFYIKEKANLTSASFHGIQFILLKKLRDNS
jgi:hypothetical protein